MYTWEERIDYRLMPPSAAASCYSIDEYSSIYTCCLA